MPSKIFYASCGAKILTIVRTIPELEKIESSRTKIIFRMIKQRDTSSRIKQFVRKNCWRNFETSK